MNTQAFELRDDERRPPANDLLEVVQQGLGRTSKQLPSWLFYDERGSQLFEDICEQPEYYLTRAELALMREHGQAIADVLGADVRLVEFGSGSAIKTRILLEHPVTYVPVEIAGEPLRESVKRFGEIFPQLPIQPLHADFTKPLRLPVPPRTAKRTVVYFPGSTIGNFDQRDASRLLRTMRDEMGENGAILIGVDLKKNPATIEAAYNDKAGVTAEFTLNMLVRLNRELGCDFAVHQYRHRARYNAWAGRIETHIVSTVDQRVRAGSRRFDFSAGEAMLVEYSCKYSLEDFAQLASRAGLRVAQVWLDRDGLFSVQMLVRS